MEPRFAVFALLMSATVLGLSGRLIAHEYRELARPDGSVLRYAVVLPVNFDPERTYPALLALPPGPQTEAMVEAGLSRYWGEQAAQRGWIVVSPVAPEGKSFYSGGEEAIPALIEYVMETWSIEGGKLHLAGASNGGRSAFRVATLHPERFHTMTVLPGFPPTDADVLRVPQLKDVPLTMFVGGDDTRWIDPMMETEAALRAAGGDVSLTVLPGEGHVPPSLDGDVMMTHLESRRAVAAVVDVLNVFHDAASRADGDGYFGAMTDDAVFIGTDPNERWTRAEFMAFAEPHFSAGRGWAYAMTERHVSIAADGATAWFDEMLDNEKYGTCRGTGVVVQTPDGWKIAQYALTIPIPNELAAKVVEMGRASPATDE